MIDARHAIDSVFEGKGGTFGPNSGGAGTAITNRWYITPRVTIRQVRQRPGTGRPVSRYSTAPARYTAYCFPDKVLDIGYVPRSDPEWIPSGFNHPSDVCATVTQRVQSDKGYEAASITLIQAHVNWVAWYIAATEGSDQNSVNYAAGPELAVSDFALVSFDHMNNMTAIEIPCRQQPMTKIDINA